MKNILCVLALFVFGLVLITPSNVVALDGGAESSYKAALNDTGGKTGSGATVTETLQAVINILLFIAGIAAVLVIVVSGFRFVTSNGDAGAVSKAKNSIIYATIGLAITVMAYAIVNFILENI